MRLRLLPELIAVCRLSPDTPLPAELFASKGFCSVTRTKRELSVVIGEAHIRTGSSVLCERGWRVFEVEGPLSFTLTGVLSSLTAPLAEAGIGVFAISTYDTDYLLVKSENVAAAMEALRRAGHEMEPERP